MATDYSSITVCVVGTGRMGRRHLRNVREFGMEVLGVCDPLEASRDAAAEAGVSRDRIFDNSGDMLARLRPDLVVIASTTPDHLQSTAHAVAAGARFILCEKPMATSGAETRRIVELCRDHDCRLAVNLGRRFAPRYRRLKALLASGAIGDVKHMAFSVGAGGLGCAGTHFFDLAAWFVDTRPVRVSARIDERVTVNVRGSQYFDPGGSGAVLYANGMTVAFEMSGDIAVLPTVVITGTWGQARFDEWPESQGGRLEVWGVPRHERDRKPTDALSAEPHPVDIGAPLSVFDMSKECLVDLFGDHVEDTATGGIDSVDIVMAVHLSAARNRAWLDLPLTGNDLDFSVPIT